MGVSYQTKCAEIRKKIISTAFHCQNNAHLGGALSMVELLAVVYEQLTNNPTDRFILSKGHGVLALYCTMCEYGVFDEHTLATFQMDGSDLVAHPVMNPQICIESSNGSLGQGLSMAVGLSLSNKMKQKQGITYVVVGNGECNEGSIWEAAMAAAQYKLDNLVLIVDNNKLQSDGASADIMDISNFAERFVSFGWNAIEVNGHDANAIHDAVCNHNISHRPKCIVADTIKGKGISFMENNPLWHHNKLNEEQYLQAMRDLEVQ